MAQNSPFDIPPSWQKAALNEGPSLISRALLEGNRLVLKMSVIVDSDGRPTTNNYIPRETSMLPVLVVDIANNQTEDVSTPATTTAERPLNLRENVLRRIRQKRMISPRIQNPNHHNKYVIQLCCMCCLMNSLFNFARALSYL